MSELSSHDTGVDLQKLKGQDNYVRWSRDFKVMAEVKGVWKVITGDEPILSKPLREDYFPSFKDEGADRVADTAKIEDLTPAKKPSTRASMKKAQLEAADDDSDEATTPTLSSAQLSARISEYKLDLEEYEKNNKMVRTANALMAYWIDPAIRGKVQSFNSPYLAWEWIRSQYKMQDARSLDIALARMEKLKMAICSSAQDYLNQHEMCRMDIEDVGGVYTDAQMVSKIMRGLSPQWNFFTDQYHFLQDTNGLENPDLKALTSRLLTFESKLNERNSNKTANNLNKKGDDSKKGNGSKERKKREKCPVEGCGKWGHTADTCWV